MLTPSPSPICVLTQERNANFYFSMRKKPQEAHEHEANLGVPLSLLPINRLIRAPSPLCRQPPGTPAGCADSSFPPGSAKGHVFFLPSSVPDLELSRAGCSPGPTPLRRWPIAPRGVARCRPLRPRPAAFVLPRSLSQPVRSGQTEWQLLIGGRGSANQKGAPHVRARSFKRVSHPARAVKAWEEGGRGGRCSDAGLARPRLPSLPANRRRGLPGEGSFPSLAFRVPGQSPRSRSAPRPPA